jgi:hypothetical protein
MATLEHQVTPDEMTRSQRRAMAYVTGRGAFEVRRCEWLSEGSKHLFVVVGVTRECWTITPRGKARRCSD